MDGHKTMLRILKTLLNQIGFEDVDQATDGEEALKMFGERSYGLVISEWDLENLSGYEFLKSVRGGAKNSNAPFIMLAAETKSENVIKAKQAGVNGYIVKPFNQETLEAKIKAVFTVMPA